MLRKTEISNLYQDHWSTKSSGGGSLHFKWWVRKIWKKVQMNVAEKIEKSWPRLIIAFLDFLSLVEPGQISHICLTLYRLILGKYEMVVLGRYNSRQGKTRLNITTVNTTKSCITWWRMYARSQTLSSKLSEATSPWNIYYCLHSLWS